MTDAAAGTRASEISFRADSARLGPWAAGVVLLLGVALSFWVWYRAAEDLKLRADVNAERLTALAFANIQQSVSQQTDVVLAFRALFSTGTPSRKDFAQLYSDLRLGNRDLSLKAVQFAKFIPHNERPALEAAVRRDTSLDAAGYPNFAIHPSGVRTAYEVVVFNEPMLGNEQALGQDDLAEATRREAQERARDSGQPQLSAPLKLWDGQTGYLIRVPVYRPQTPLDTAEQRRAAYVGQVSGVFSAAILLASARDMADSQNFGLAVHDQGAVNPTAALPATTLLAERKLTQALAGQRSAQPGPTTRRHHVEVGGRVWALEVSGVEHQHGLSRWPVVLLCSGLALSALLAVTLAWTARSRQNARALAERMSTEARTAARRLDAILNNAAEGIFTLDAMGNVRSANQAARAMFGLASGMMVGKPLGELMAPQGNESPAKRSHDLLDPDSLGLRRTRTAMRADGNPFPVELVVAEADVDGERHRVATVRDLTETQAADEAVMMTMQELHEATEVRESMLRHAAFAIVLCGSDGLIRAFNPAAEKLLQRSAADVVGHSCFQELVVPDDLTAAAVSASEQSGQSVEPGMAALVAGLAEEAEARSVEREIHLLRSDGLRVPVSLTITSLRAGADSAGHYLLIAYDITERRQLGAQMARLAYTDALTGLPNRTQLERELQRALASAKRYERCLSLLFIDLDRFKPINDRYGHAMGDAVLREVAARLPKAVRQSDLCARIGGDEFVVLLPEVANPGDGLLVAEKIVNALSAPMHLAGEVLTIGCSVGIVGYPSGGDDADALLRQADAAMYEVKQSGRNGYREKARV